MPNTCPPLTLIHHATTPAPVVSRIEASVERQADGGAIFFFCLRGDMARMRIPEETRNERTDLLWEHTCFESFVGVRGHSAYREFNFSPSGQWASYTFADYREPVGEQPDEFGLRPPLIITRRTAGRLELEASIEAGRLPPNPDNEPWEIALTAVVETDDTLDGSHSYWALKHTTPRPDFHQRETFTLLLAA